MLSRGGGRELTQSVGSWQKASAGSVIQITRCLFVLQVFIGFPGVGTCPAARNDGDGNGDDKGGDRRKEGCGRRRRTTAEAAAWAWDEGEGEGDGKGGDMGAVTRPRVEGCSRGCGR